MPDYKGLLEITKLNENLLEPALRYCKGKKFLDITIAGHYRPSVPRIKESKIDFTNSRFFIKGITAEGIDIIKKPEDEKGNRPFNETFNLDKTFNVDSIIKGEAKLF